MMCITVQSDAVMHIFEQNCLSQTMFSCFDYKNGVFLPVFCDDVILFVVIQKRGKGSPIIDPRSWSYCQTHGDRTAD